MWRGWWIQLLKCPGKMRIPIQGHIVLNLFLLNRQKGYQVQIIRFICILDWMCDTRMNNGLNSTNWLVIGRMTRSRWRMVTLQILLKTPLSLKIRGRWDWWTLFFRPSTMETQNFYCRSSSGERRFGSTPIVDLLSLFKLTTNSIIVSIKWLLSHILNWLIIFIPLLIHR